ncbi:hypothetical protein CW731_05430 [Polaribacter sp. ALD11]|uniref:hypothetical protein n=1 Tax=Polaribacter sp. ALD11 TaxID=2058137 RepID=UPI000C313E6C|nr:hypothetical protein [Polaribacter sp. ALD11]AUC84768.1 hypothetical protein CW731_05430 [Polaribacter sp. ALD11]
MIPNTFIENTGEILGKTAGGLSGSQIANLLASYGFDFNVDVPFPKSPFPADGSVPNKRFALKRNLEAFNAEQQFKIIKELCELEKFNGNSTVKDLKMKLITRFGHLNTESDKVNEMLIDETRHWLHGFDDSLKEYNSALEKFKNSIFERNLLDDLRLSLELLVKQILGNDKSLENQLGALGTFIKDNNGSKELGNMFQKLVEYFTKYQNSYVKHDNKVIEEEIEFILEITSSFMKHFIRMNK